MNVRRLLIISSLSLLLLNLPAAFSQEAIERSSPPPLPAEENAETPSAEVSATAEPTPRKRKKPAATVESSQTSGRDIQDVMTAQEFKAAGLNKLSEDQLRNLNAWLQGYRQTAETKAAEKATAEATQKAATTSRASMDNLLSRVDDENFTGVTGKSIIKLEDGTVWKQANQDDRYHAQVTNHPPARVSHSTFGYKMHIVGLPEFYVDPVRK